MLDDIDRGLIEALQINGRASFTVIAPSLPPVRVTVAVRLGPASLTEYVAALNCSVPGAVTETTSSAPMSGVAGRASPSMSSTTPALAPSASIGDVGWRCRSVFETNNGSTLRLALSFVPAADNVLEYERKFVAGVVWVGSKSASVNSPVPKVVPRWAKRF